MAQMGFRTVSEMIGQSDRLDMRTAIAHWKAKGLDYSKLLAKPFASPGTAIHNRESQDHGLEKALDHTLIAKAAPALEKRKPVQIVTPVKNVNRTVGAMLSGEVAKRYGQAGLPEDTIYIKAKGSGGQSFGAFLAHGITIELEGDANDYTGKGLSGGRLVIYPPRNSVFVPEQNIVVGNVVLYGAIAGTCFFRGVAGERFAVRNSGAVAVVEGVGDHGCEYMTGGVVVVLGSTGRNFAAGMSGGIAYVLDEEGEFERRCNLAMVDLESVVAEAPPVNPALLEDHTRYDATRLRDLIEKHMHSTDSARARHILDNWNRYLPKFVKIMPTDYRRALTERQARAAEADAEPPRAEYAAGE
jgi:glutamate synthase (NADPH/NADH) large chain